MSWKTEETGLAGGDWDLNLVGEYDDFGGDVNLSCCL
jgi:hypothetical protein